MAGIHIHPHDILDEGSEQILTHIGKMVEITTIFPQVNTIFERNPNPSGNLPHNPVRPVVMGNGKMHASIDTQSISPNLYQQVDETIIRGQDPLAAFKQVSQDHPYEVVPWVNLLNGHFSGNLDQNSVIDYKGNQITAWLCPNGPDVVPMWSQVLLALTETYGYTTYMIDRIRYPDWSGEEVNPKEMFTCFCQHCCAKMNEQGIDPDELIRQMKLIEVDLRDKHFDSAVDIFLQSQLMKKWIQFRQESISQFVEQLSEAVRERNPSIQFWLDLWPPSYAWILGQDYGRLTRSSSKLKHFPYHKLGGGADVQGLIEYFSDTPAEREAAFRAFLRLFKLPYSLTYMEFQQKGYPLSFVQAENNQVRKIAQPGTKIYSGIQMWNISNEDLIEAIHEAEASEADDLIYYCYGWAELTHFEAIAKRM